MDEFDENAEYVVDLEKIITKKELLSVTRLLAASLIAEPYTTIQNFFLGLNDMDLRTLMDASESEDKEHFGDVILISEMLALGEGLEPGDMSVTIDRTRTMAGYLVVESLARKGLVKVNRENMSFGADMGDKIIVEKI